MKEQALALNRTGALLRTLSHQIRNSLSTISNDLFYFQSLLPAGECQRTQTCCRDLAQMLSDVCEHLASPLQREPVPIKSFCRTIFGDALECSGDGLDSLAIALDQAKIEFAFRELKDLWARYPTPADGINIALTRQQEKCELIIYAGRKNPQKYDVSGLSEIFDQILKLDLWQVPVIGLIFDAHGFGTSVRGPEVHVLMEE